MMNTKQSMRHTKWLALVGAGLVAGCSFFGEPAEEPPADIAETSEAPVEWVQPEATEPIVYHDNVYEVAEEVVANVDLDGHILTVPTRHAGDLLDRQVGDIVFSNYDPVFRARITEIAHSEDRLVLQTEEASLSEAVRSGQFQVYFPAAIVDDEGLIVDINPSEDLDLAQAQQDLNLSYTVEREVASMDFNANFAGESSLELHDSSVTVRLVEASLHFRPAVLASFTISTDGSIDVGVEVIGEARATLEVEVEAYAFFGVNRAVNLPVTNPRSFNIVGTTFTIQPFLRANFRANGRGEGTYGHRFVAEGNVRAGVTRGITGGSGTNHTFSHQFATNHHPTSSGAFIEADARLGLDAGIALYRGNTSGDKLVEVVPLSANFRAHAETLFPRCPYEAQFFVDSFIQVFEPSHYWDRRHWGLDVSGELTGFPGCMPETPTDQCQGPSDCGSGETCNAGSCQPDVELLISTTWHSHTNLDLYVKTPSGDLISVDNPGNSTLSGKLLKSSCGGCESETGGYVESVGFDRANSGDEFLIWVVNNDGRTENQVSYNLTVNHRGTFEETYVGNMGSEAGSQSLRYRYIVP